jgi:hypothetical protein
MLNLMTIEFTLEQEQFIKQSLASGRYSNEAEVIREAWLCCKSRSVSLRTCVGFSLKRIAVMLGLMQRATFDLIEQEVQAHRKGNSH